MIKIDGKIVGAIVILGFVAGAVAVDTAVKKTMVVKTDAKKVAPKNTSFKTVQTDLKIRVIDLGDAMRTSKEGQEVKNDIVAKEQSARKQIEDKQNEFSQKVAEFESKRTTLSQQALDKEQGKLVELKSDYDALVKKKEQEFQLLNQQVTGRLADKVGKAVEEVAKEEKYDVVIDKMTGSVVYASGDSVCTNKVVEVMDKHYNLQVASVKGTKKATVTA